MIQTDHPSLMMQPRWVDIIRNNAAEAEQLGKLNEAQLALVYEQQWFNLVSPVNTAAYKPHCPNW
jgi:hypothetical protein